MLNLFQHLTALDPEKSLGQHSRSEGVPIPLRKGKADDATFWLIGI
jgi:hypothetical protein